MVEILSSKTENKYPPKPTIQNLHMIDEAAITRTLTSLENMGKKKSYQDKGGGKGSRQRYGGEKPYAESEKDLRHAVLPTGHAAEATVPMLDQHQPIDSAEGGGEAEDEDHDLEPTKRPAVNTRLCMWEFGQNDPKRDSGSKLKRLGYASLLKIGQSFPGARHDLNSCREY